MNTEAQNTARQTVHMTLAIIEDLQQETTDKELLGELAKAYNTLDSLWRLPELSEAQLEEIRSTAKHIYKLAPVEIITRLFPSKSDALRRVAVDTLAIIDDLQQDTTDEELLSELVNAYNTLDALWRVPELSEAQLDEIRSTAKHIHKLIPEEKA